MYINKNRLYKAVQRRHFIKNTFKLAITFTAAIFQSKRVHAAWPAEHFASGEFAIRFQQLFADQTIVDSHDINISLPSIAENGAVVPIIVTSELEQIERLYIWVEKNPTPLAAEIEFSRDMAIYLTARIKMAESCNVIVIAKQGERLLRNQQWVNVMLGGCGTG